MKFFKTNGSKTNGSNLSNFWQLPRKIIKKHLEKKLNDYYHVKLDVGFLEDFHRKDLKLNLETLRDQLEKERSNAKPDMDKINNLSDEISAAQIFQEQYEQHKETLAQLISYITYLDGLLKK